jgi:Putative 2OG-Fe(II) oxygenase
MIAKHLLFPSLVLEKHDTNFTKIKSTIESNIMNHITDDGWSNELNGFVTLHQDPNFKDLFDFVASAVKDYIITFNADPNEFDVYIVKSWANIVKNRGNPVHNHADAHLSFVYYVNVPGTVNTPIVFHNHYYRHEPFVGFCQWNSKSWDLVSANSWQFKPKEGQVMVFPSTMSHETTALSNQPDVGVADLADLKNYRFSIAGDIVLTYKNTQAKPLGLQPIQNWLKV